MITIEQCRKIDPRLELLTDEQVTKIRDGLYALGELAFETWLEEECSSNVRPGVDGLNNAVVPE
jgi:hypothetical protein